MKLKPNCCKGFSQIIPQLGWFYIDDNPEQFTMPYLPGQDGEKYRVNYCPVCGKYIRDIIIAMPNEENTP